MSVQLRLISDEERTELEERSIKAGLFRHGLIEPGMMWFMPWAHDPADPRDMAVRAVQLENPERRGMLSPHYWRDWSDKRSPIMVVCPNRQMWCVDQWSSNGTGWTVRGEGTALVVTPPIVVPGYHGWLGSGGAAPGWFTGDVEGRGPMGVVG